ncbi:MAG: undecaprenyl-diphosphate phosphatase [Acidimicrobiia bacterium]
MSVLHAIILGIVQGLTEFLPISSSGHLILVPKLLGWEPLPTDVEKTFDVALHVGTLLGAAVYLRHDLAKYISAAWRSLRTRSLADTDGRVGWLLLATVIPGALLGALFENVINEKLGNPILIGVMLIVFGVILFLVDRYQGDRTISDFHGKDALIAGIAQAVALQPGVSRSGITMTALRWKKFDRETSARISFLMLIPIVAGASVFSSRRLFHGFPPEIGPAAFAAGLVAAAITGWIVVFGLLKYLRTHSFLPFVIYRIVVGVAVIVIFAAGWR